MQDVGKHSIRVQQPFHNDPTSITSTPTTINPAYKQLQSPRKHRQIKGLRESNARGG
jgi:hypothetical protein